MSLLDCYQGCDRVQTRGNVKDGRQMGYDQLRLVLAPGKICTGPTAMLSRIRIG